MLQITLENLTELNQSDLPPFTESTIKEQLSPLPFLFDVTGKTLSMDMDTKISIRGKEEAFETFPTLIEDANIDYLVLPEWNNQEFLQRIVFWLNFRLEELNSPLRFDKKQMIGDTLNGSETDNSEPISKQRRKILEGKIPPTGRRQGYYLSIEDHKITIQAWTMIGAYYGVVSLCQMIKVRKKSVDKTAHLPEIEIYDYPKYRVRGLVDDISRGQRPTMNNFKKFIRFLSRGKQNFLVLYMEDIVKFEKYPQIGKDRGALTKDDLREIQDYAKKWFVTIIPGFELLGHMDNMLLDPDLMKYAEFPGAQCFNVSDPKTKEFVKDLIQELVPVFESQMFAPICDESFDFGLRRSREYVEEKGWGEALAEWYIFLIEEIKKAGKDIVLFAHDILIKDKHVMETIQKENAVVYYWDYSKKKKYPKIDKLKKQGLTVVGGPAVFDWSRHYPYFDYAEKNTINMATDGLERGLIGLVTTKWGDFFNENFRNNIFYGLSVNAQAAWSPFKSDVPQIRKSFIWNFFGTHEDKIIECMDILSMQNEVLPRWPNGMLNRFWYDPYVRKIKKKEYGHAQRFIKEAKKVLRTIQDIRENAEITVNKKNLRYLEFAARMARHYGIKILVSESTYHGEEELLEIADQLMKFQTAPSDTKHLSAYKWLKNDAQALLEDYKVLWRNLAVEEGLEYPKHRFEVLAWHYQKAIESLLKGEKPHTHQLKSKWIWRSGIRWNVEWGNGEFFYFIKPFEITKNVKKATIQGIANNHLNLFFDGKEVGSVYSRFSLSQYPMAKAVQWFDITPETTKGEHIISVEGANWAYGIGGINVILHLEYNDGTQEDIITDGTWKWRKKKPEKWPLTKPTQHKKYDWSNVKVQGKPPGAWMGPITEPLWKKGWKSSISFIFGCRNFTETAIRTQIGPTVYKMFFWLVKPLARFFSIDMYILREN